MSSSPVKEDDIFESKAERAWSESSSLHGVDQDLMSARRDDLPYSPPPLYPAAISPALIPLSALMAGPLVAAIITLMADGRPPKLSQLAAVLSVAIVAWLTRQGLRLLSMTSSPPHLGPIFALSLMFITGVLLWAIYTFWQKGRRAMDQQTLQNNVVVAVVISGLFWLGRNSTLWIWLGR